MTRLFAVAFVGCASGSAALAVAVVRALDDHFGLDLGDERINELAFECEKAAHGTPSGIDNTLATYGSPLLYCNSNGPEFTRVAPGRPLHLAVGLTGKESLTAQTVAAFPEALTVVFPEANDGSD